MTGTPPIRPRKADGTLRKEASVRRATESARVIESLKKNIPGQKQRAVSDNMHLKSGLSQPPPVMSTVRSSRFVSSRNAPASHDGLPTRFTADGGLETAQRIPRQHLQGNTTVHSAVHTVIIGQLQQGQCTLLLPGTSFVATSGRTIVVLSCKGSKANTKFLPRQ